MRTVYAIELSPTAFCRASNRATSPTGLPAVYVGQSWHSPEQRYEIHRAGGMHSSKWVRDFGARLRPELYVDVPAVHDLSQAEESEAALAERLRQIGFTAITDGRVLRPGGGEVSRVPAMSPGVEEILDPLAFRLAATLHEDNPVLLADLLTEVDARRHSECVGRFAHVEPAAVCTRLEWLAACGYLARAAHVAPAA